MQWRLSGFVVWISSWESFVIDTSAQCVCTGDCLGLQYGSQAGNQLLLINQHNVYMHWRLSGFVVWISSWESFFTDKSAHSVYALMIVWVCSNGPQAGNKLLLINQHSVCIGTFFRVSYRCSWWAFDIYSFNFS